MTEVEYKTLLDHYEETVSHVASLKEKAKKIEDDLRSAEFRKESYRRKLLEYGKTLPAPPPSGTNYDEDGA